MAPGLTQPLKDTSTRNISWGVKAASEQQPFYLHVPIVLKLRSLSLLEPYDSLQVCKGITLPFTQFTVYCVADFDVITYLASVG
jgi:hypothetical protein